MGVAGEVAVQLPGPVVPVMVVIQVHVNGGRHDGTHLNGHNQENCDSLPHHNPDS
jgi:hypothetical protein